MTEIRACRPEDIPAVARLFQNTFLDPQRAPPASLQAYLGEIFLNHPWYDPGVGPRVHIDDDGKLSGFIGVLPLRLSFRGQKIRGAVAGSLMVEKPEQNPLAGARLLRSFITGPQDLSITETANRLSRGMWEKLGGRPVPLESMEWVRVFHPATFALSVLADRAPFLRLTRPFCSLADAIAGKIKQNPLLLDPKAMTDPRDDDVGDDVLLQRIPEFAASYALRPDWEPQDLQWFLNHAAHKERRGPLFRRVVYDRRNSPVGCYLYYERPRHVAWVLQVLALPDSAGLVVDSLLSHAYRQG